MIGDFNAVIGSYENFGRLPQNKTLIDEFLSWTNQNALMHIDTNGNYYTCTNGRKGGVYSYVRIDRAICNLNWLDNWNTINFFTLIKDHSDHYHILLHCDKGRFDSARLLKIVKVWTIVDRR